jgi:hypothetical protein
VHWIRERGYLQNKTWKAQRVVFFSNGCHLSPQLLDLDLVVLIKVCIVCTHILVFTLYASPFIICWTPNKLL